MYKKNLRLMAMRVCKRKLVPPLLNPLININMRIILIRKDPEIINIPSFKERGNSENNVKTRRIIPASRTINNKRKI